LFLLAKNLKLLYQKIDAIEVFFFIFKKKEYVNFVGGKVLDLEKKVTEIEKQDQTTIFSFFGAKKPNTPISV
jgi:hypothetical protein